MLLKSVPLYFDINVLPEPQRRLWKMLGGTPSGFVLYGGTALALRLGHRQSVDFDFFSRDAFQPDSLRRHIPYLSGSLTTRSEENTLSCVLNLDGEVMVSFFGGLGMSSVNDPDKADGPGILVASLLDIAATKAAAVQSRANAKDYIDLDALLRSGLSLEEALGAANAVFGPEFNPLVTLKALAHYADGNLHQVPNEVRVNLTQAVAAVNVKNLPVFGPHARLVPTEQQRSTTMACEISDDALGAREPASPDRSPEQTPLGPAEPALLEIARRVVWFQPPHETLRDEVQFLSHAMIYGSSEDTATIRRAYGDEALRDALRNAWPGIFDPRSWSYWHTVLGMLPVPAMHIRQFPAEPGEAVPEVSPAIQGHGGPPRGRGTGVPDRNVPAPNPSG